MKVIFSAGFQAQFPTLTNADKQAILAFVRHVEQHGLKDLAGRNKSSAPQNPHTKKERENFAHAQKHCLWHYHLGVPCYIRQASGDLTSEYILHYQRFDDEIRIIAMTAHPPFVLPTVE